MTEHPATDHRPRYQAPDAFTRKVLNPAVAGLARLGLSIRGSRLLEVRGRSSGEPRRTPVNPLTVEGTDYLVAPRGETQWVRNLRADDGRLTLIIGRRRQPRQATEVIDDDRKVVVLRAYLARWKAETGKFFGLGADASDAEIRAVAPDHPVFALARRA